jgi:hypothetical protein
MEPTLVKNGVMGSFDKATGSVNVADVRVSCGVTNKNACKVVLVQFSPPIASAFYTDT